MGGGAAEGLVMDEHLAGIQEEIVRLLLEERADYARPLSSARLAGMLRATPSYVREQVGKLRRQRLVSVRRGRGGGYYLSEANLKRHQARARPG